MRTGLQVIGAGLPRTGTRSLKNMLERLLDGSCYHMTDLYQRSDIDGPKWMAILNGQVDLLDEVLDGWVAAVDWPASIVWRELAAQNPEAVIVLSHRASSDQWWTSADQTVWHVMREVKRGTAPEHVKGVHQLMRACAGFDEDLAEPLAKARYEEHNAEVLAAIPDDRLIRWKPEDGWEPLCDRLGLPIPDEEPAHVNTSTEFRGRLGLEPQPPGTSSHPG